MTTSIGKLSKSFFVKVLVGIIILPFVFWGMGDVFRGGNQNVIATIDSNKVSTQEFMNYLNRLNLNKEQINNLKKGDLAERILSEFVGKKVMSLEIEQMGITVSDNSLRNILKNDELFIKDNKFSRLEYEKFLLKSGVTAPTFEKNIVQQESRRQFLSFLAGGLTINKNLIENEFKKENQTKLINYIDLNKYHSNKKLSQKKIEELYEKNKNLFVEIFKSIQYAEISPEVIAGKKEYDENFFKILDSIENNILDGQSFEDASKENNLKTILISNINEEKKDRKNNKIDSLPDNLFKKIYSIKNEKTPEILKIDNKYFLAEIKLIEKKIRPINDPLVKKVINEQLSFQNKIENNTFLIKEISMGGFDKIKMENFASKNNLEIKNYKISNLNQNDIFSEGIIKRIFLMEDGKIDLITNSALTKNFLVFSIKTQYKKLDEKTNEFEQYEAKARLNLVNKIYRIYDESLNRKYKVELNKRTIDRVKNSF